MNYEAFMRVVKNVKPYRGTDAYPVGERRYSHRHFIVVDGVVQVWHCHLKRATELRKNKIREESRKWVSERHVVSVYPDNTVEFHNMYGIGDSMFLSRLFHGYIGFSSRHGGAIWSKYLVNNELRMHPVFKGLRVSIDDLSLHPDSQYKLIYRRVIPKEKKRILGRIREQAEIANVMIDSMRIEDVKATWIEFRQKDDNRLEKLHEAIANNYCLDTVVYMTLFNRSSWWIEHAPEIRVVKDRIKDMFDKGMDYYLGHQEEAFKYIEREPFDFPSATWGVKVKVGDKFAERL